MTLTAKEKACLCRDTEGHPACLPELCPYANGYYDRLKTALSALLDGGSGCFDRTVLAETGRKFSVCPFELGLDLSEWCDVVIGDYNYLFDPVVRLRRFFDASGDWLFLIDEAHNLPDRARAMYSASFSKASLTEAKRSLGPGKSALKTALRKADKAFLEARRAVAELAPGTAPCPRKLPPPKPNRPACWTPRRRKPHSRCRSRFLRRTARSLSGAARRAVKAPAGPDSSLQDWLEQHPNAEAHTALLDLYFLKYRTFCGRQSGTTSTLPPS